ncbi:MAG: hypothetical protein COA82_01880, partial [Alkaliphilus sp.]
IFAFLWLLLLNFNKNTILPYVRSNAIDKINAEVGSLSTIVDMGVDRIRIRTELDAAKEMDFESLKPFLDVLVDNGHFHKIGLVFLDGTITDTSGLVNSPLPDREYYKEIFNKGPIVTAPIRSAFDDSYIVPITMPITSNNKTVGALIGAIPANDIEEIIFSLSINNAGYGFLSDIDGNMLMHPYLDEIKYTNVFELVDEEVKEYGTKEYYLKYTDKNGIDRYIFYKSLPDTGWLVGIDVPATAVYYISNNIINKLMLASFVSFILFITLIYYSTIKLFKPMDKLINEMKKAEKGDLSVQTNIVRKDEISEIAIQFNKTIADIYARDEEIKALNEELDANYIELRDSNNEINKTNEKLMLAYEEITKNFQNAKLVNKLSEKLFSVSDFSIIVNGVLAYTHEMINATKSAIYLFDSDINKYTIRESINYSNEEVKKLKFRIHEGSFAWISENKCELYSENAYDDDRFIPKTLSRKGKMCYELPILSEKNELIGVMSYISNDLDMKHIHYFKQLAKMISIEIANNGLSVKIEETYIDVLIALIKGLELKDKYTSGHSERVMEYSIMIGERVGLSVQDMKVLQYGSMMHDIGKIGIPDEILLKKGSLTRQEYELIKTHPANGESFMSSLRFLEDTLPIIRNHHERIDGKGYPDNLDGDNIPILARIVAIADAYDAMSSERPYRHALTKEKAIEELINNSGTQFDSDFVQIFIGCINYT